MSGVGGWTFRIVLVPFERRVRATGFHVIPNAPAAEWQNPATCGGLNLTCLAAAMHRIAPVSTHIRHSPTACRVAAAWPCRSCHYIAGGFNALKTKTDRSRYTIFFSFHRRIESSASSSIAMLHSSTEVRVDGVTGLWIWLRLRLTSDDRFDIRNSSYFFLQIRRIRVFWEWEKIRSPRPLTHKDERYEHSETGLDYDCI